MAEQYLVLFDADKIKDYVFATGRLKEIRGASEQVRQLTDGTHTAVPLLLKDSGLQRWTPDAHEGIIYAGGGAGALLILRDNQEQAEAFCRDLERRYRRATHSATLSAVAVAVEQNDAAQAQQHAAQALAQRKASRSRAEALPGGGFIRFCDSDRLYPASQSVRDPDGRSKPLSRASANKYTQNSRYRQNLSKQPYWASFLAHYTEEARAAWATALDDDNDLNAIGRQARPQGYIALVYLDGDRVGSTMRDVVREHGFAGYQTFSDILAKAAYEATAIALARVYQQPPGPGAGLPFEVITIGGDDVILVCTGDQGLAVATHLSQTFRLLVEQQSAEFGWRVTASAGVVIAHDSHPIVNLEARAAELLKSAKRRTSRGEGRIDFHMVSTPGLGRIADIRSDQYAPPHQNKSLSFVARPYHAGQMETLIQKARTLQAIPARKRSQLYRACMQAPDRIVATLDMLRVQMRLGSQRQLVLDALRDLGVGMSYPFFVDDTGRYVTPLIDLLEAAEFVGKEMP